MAHLDIDSIKGIDDPISFTLKKKEYKVDSLRSDILDEALRIGRRADEKSSEYDPDASITEIQAEQLAALTGADVEEFEDLDVRLTSEALAFVLSEIGKSSDKRNRRQRRKR